YLGDPHDLKDLADGLDVAREIGNSTALRPYTVREITPAFRKSAELECFFRNGLSTFWHQCGTAKMGRDAASVVDGRLKVHGVDGLRVADASILPRVTTGNTMAPCVVIGELAAAFVQENKFVTNELQRAGIFKIGVSKIFRSGNETKVDEGKHE